GALNVAWMVPAWLQVLHLATAELLVAALSGAATREWVLRRTGPPALARPVPAPRLEHPGGTPA
ncbi:MAG: hypothetical protein AB1609_16135, partial [Bacillota bacterium]